MLLRSSTQLRIQTMPKIVSAEALAAAYHILHPTEASRAEQHIDALREWLTGYSSDPKSAVSSSGWDGKVTQALLKALNIKSPNTLAMALFILESPEVETRATMLTYVSAKQPDTDANLDLFVRAFSREHAEIVWRDHFNGWDLPDKPGAINAIPIAGPAGAISWDELCAEHEQMVETDDPAPAP
jgi:hypothetical protein